MIERKMESLATFRSAVGICLGALLLGMVGALQPVLAAPGTTIIDFETLPGGGSVPLNDTIGTNYSSLGVSFRSIGAAGWPKFSRFQVPSTYAFVGSTTYPPGHNLIADFSVLVYEVSANVTSAAGVEVTMEARDSGGAVIASTTSAPAPAPYNFSRRVYLATQTPIASVEWWPSVPQSGIGIDNLSITGDLPVTEIALTSASPATVARGAEDISFNLNGTGFSFVSPEDLRVYLGSGVVLAETNSSGNAAVEIVSNSEIRVIVSNVFADTSIGFRDAKLRYGPGPGEVVTLADAFEVIDSTAPMRTYSGLIRKDGLPGRGIDIELLQGGSVFETATTNTNGRFTMNLPDPLPAGVYTIRPADTAGVLLFSPEERSANFSTSYYAFDFDASTVATGGWDFSVSLSPDDQEIITSNGSPIAIRAVISGLPGDATLRSVETTLRETAANGDPAGNDHRVSMAGSDETWTGSFSSTEGFWEITSVVEAVRDGETIQKSTTHQFEVRSLATVNPNTLEFDSTEHIEVFLGQDPLHGPRAFGDPYLSYSSESELVATLTLPEGLSEFPTEIFVEFVNRNSGIVTVTSTLALVNSGNGVAEYVGSLDFPEEELGERGWFQMSWVTSESIGTGRFGKEFGTNLMIEIIESEITSSGPYFPGQRLKLRYRLEGPDGQPLIGDFHGAVEIADDVGNLRKSLLSIQSPPNATGFRNWRL